MSLEYEGRSSCYSSLVIGKFLSFQVHVYHREPPTGYPLPDDTEESPYQNDKASRQQASQQSSYLPWENGTFFSLSDSFFIRRMLHRQLIMVTRQVSTMSAWIRSVAQAFL